MARNRLRNIWRSMLGRCDSATAQKTTRYYQEAGVTVCQEWRESFEVFRTWATSNGYRDDLTLDRKNSLLGYSPGNCQWSTWPEQMHNRVKRMAASSPFKGVSFHKGSKLWRAQITVDGRHRHIGLFGTDAEAARAYDEQASRIFGKSARLNFEIGASSRAG